MRDAGCRPGKHHEKSWQICKLTLDGWVLAGAGQQRVGRADELGVLRRHEEAGALAGCDVLRQATACWIRSCPGIESLTFRVVLA